jgi:hypothetical protein
MHAVIVVIVVLLVIGIVAWLVDNYAPVDAGIKQLIKFVLILLAVVYLIRFIANFTHFTF